MALHQRHANIGRSRDLLILTLLLTARTTTCDDDIRIVPPDKTTSDPETTLTATYGLADRESAVTAVVASSGERQEDDPVFGFADLECTIENSRVWTKCASCLCCYKTNEIRANCFGNITDVPTDLPENITHLTLRETLIEKISAMNRFDLKISKFSVYPELIQLELKDNEMLAEIEVGAFDFEPLVVPKSSLKNIFIDGSPNLKEIVDGAFGYFHSLSDIKIVYCGLTKLPVWKRGAFSYNMDNPVHTVYMMDFSHNRITEISENNFDVAQDVKIGTIDLSFNRITHLRSRSLNGALEIGTFKLQHNPLRSIDGFAFNSSRINNLLLSDNHLLTKLHEQTFANTNLEHLDLSRTSITSLPTAGLQSLKNLTVIGTYSLQTFPSVFKMEQIKGAKLTYAHHCCAFHHPEKQNTTAYEIFKREMAAECTTTTSQIISPTEMTRLLRTTTLSTRTIRTFGDYPDLVQTMPRGTKNLLLLMRSVVNKARRRRTAYGLDKAFGSFAQPDAANVSTFRGHLDLSEAFDRVGEDGQFGDAFDSFGDDDVVDSSEFIFAGDASLPFAGQFDDGSFHTSTLDPRETYLSTKRCGELVEHIKRVSCSPEPDAFNPCEDVLGYTWLRVIAWFVVITAEFGNISVIVVTLCSKYKLTGLTVSKFLMCNLALADLTLGTYLFVLAAFDLYSKGSYFTHAIPWQYEGGCQLAGFLATFSTCLSTFTLTVITLERWYTIRYAMNPDKRLRLRHAATIMTCGWTFALVMASLPLLGVSSFSKTSVCLPMETSDPLDEGYTIALMLGNAACFVVICVCYTDMYCKVRANNTTSAVGRSDANIAKRMASLVFTDFVCLFPIVFFGLTAAAGKPLIDVSDSKILLVVFFPLNACANPFLYVIATKHFRKDFVGMLSRFGFCERKASEYRLAMMSNPMSMSHSRNSLSGVTQNLIHRPSAGSTLTTTTCLSDHQKTPRGSQSVFNNVVASRMARHGPGTDTPSVSPEMLQGRDSDSKRLSVVAEGTTPAEERLRRQWNGSEASFRGQSLAESGRRPSADGRPPCRTVRSVSEYASRSLPRREPLSEEEIGGGGARRSRADEIGDGSVTFDGTKKRGAKHSISGDVNAPIDENVESSDGPMESHNGDNVIHTSSTDTSICPLSDRTSSSNGGVEEATPTGGRSAPAERSRSQTYSSSFGNQQESRQNDYLIIYREDRDRLDTSSRPQIYTLQDSPKQGYTNISCTLEEARLSFG